MRDEGEMERWRAVKRGNVRFNPAGKKRETKEKVGLGYSAIEMSSLCSEGEGMNSFVVPEAIEALISSSHREKQNGQERRAKSFSLPMLYAVKLKLKGGPVYEQLQTNKINKTQKPLQALSQER